MHLEVLRVISALLESDIATASDVLMIIIEKVIFLRSNLLRLVS